jgi:uncharacterized membrane protein
VAAVILLIACVLTTAIVSIVLTAVVSVSIKSHISNRQARQIQYWQNRAMRDEDPEWRQ